LLQAVSWDGLANGIGVTINGVRSASGFGSSCRLPQWVLVAFPLTSQLLWKQYYSGNYDCCMKNPALCGSGKGGKKGMTIWHFCITDRFQYTLELCIEACSFLLFFWPWDPQTTTNG
jgi:hypothetical protein